MIRSHLIKIFNKEIPRNKIYLTSRILCPELHWSRSLSVLQKPQPEAKSGSFTMLHPWLNFGRRLWKHSYHVSLGSIFWWGWILFLKTVNVIVNINDCLSNLIDKMSECAKLCSLFLSTPGSLTEHHPLVGWSGLWKSQKIIPKFLTMVSS